MKKKSNKLPKKTNTLNFAKLPPLDQRYTEDELIEAIKRNYGLITYICNELDCTGGQFLSCIHIHPYLKEVLQSCREELVDMAEHTIIKQMKEHESEKSAMFVLKTQGKKRGWSETQDINLNVNLTEEEKLDRIKEIFNMTNIQEEVDQEDNQEESSNQ